MAGSPVTRRDVVCDLGAGLGALTGPLAATGARVIAVELHPRRAAALREEYAGTRVAVVERDLRDFTFPGRPYRVVANPPYAGVNVLVRRLLADAPPALRRPRRGRGRGPRTPAASLRASASARGSPGTRSFIRRPLPPGCCGSAVARTRR